MAPRFYSLAVGETSLGREAYEVLSGGGIVQARIYGDREKAELLLDVYNGDGERSTTRSGLRYREETVTVRTTWNDVGQVEQLVNAPSGVMQRRVLNTMERQSREALISLGWTPPDK